MHVSTHIVFMTGIIQHLQGSVSKGSLSFICSISICNYALQNLLHIAQSTSPCIGCCRAVDSIAHRMLSCSVFFSHIGCCRTVDSVGHRMLSCNVFLSHIGCCRTVDSVAHRMLSRSGFCRVVDFSCTQATGCTVQITSLVVNFKIKF
jgi:hypothetical protein